MTISINDKFPTQEIRVLADGEIKNISSDEYFSGKKIVLVGVPGAFTPTCHLTHLPGYIENIKNFKDKNYSVVFIAVNDPFVMQSWSEASNASDIDMLADGNCDLTKRNEVVDVDGVKIVGYDNLPGELPKDASTLFAKNLLNFLSPHVNSETKSLELDWEDETVKNTLVTKGGSIVSEIVKGVS